MLELFQEFINIGIFSSSRWAVLQYDESYVMGIYDPGKKTMLGTQVMVQFTNEPEDLILRISGDMVVLLSSKEFFAFRCVDDQIILENHVILKEMYCDVAFYNEMLYFIPLCDIYVIQMKLDGTQKRKIFDFETNKDYQRIFVGLNESVLLLSSAGAEVFCEVHEVQHRISLAEYSLTRVTDICYYFKPMFLIPILDNKNMLCALTWTPQGFKIYKSNFECSKIADNNYCIGFATQRYAHFGGNHVHVLRLEVVNEEEYELIIDHVAVENPIHMSSLSCAQQNILGFTCLDDRYIQIASMVLSIIE
ncbi:hypothetical protein PCE1_002883 [Barthelona sp. PCE]